MIFYRLAILSFDTRSSIPTDIGIAAGENGEFRIPGMYATTNDQAFLVAAACKLKHKPKVTQKKLIVLNTFLREELENLIESYANMLSVSLNCRRSISSGHPVVALRPENDEDERLLNQCKGFYHKHQNCVSTKGDYAIDLHKDIISLNDRIDGLSLLAEALSSQSAAGQVLAFIRLYERGFALSGRKLIDPMYEFLSDTIFGYSKEEISNWIEIRDGVTHADKRNNIVLEGEAAWETSRLEQAAYDVLLNKASWRDRDSARRSVWLPHGGTTNRDGDLFIRKGVEWKSSFKIFDPFRRFSQNAQGVFNLNTTDLWIAPLVDEGRPDITPQNILVSSGEVLVLDENDTEYFLKNKR